jgi:hypothetical protein
MLRVGIRQLPADGCGRTLSGERASGMIARMQAELKAAPVRSVAAKPLVASRYLVSAPYDLGFFVLAPVSALLLTIALARFPLTLTPEKLLGTNKTWAALFIAIWTNAHLIAVVFRSHANPEIFRRFRARFTWVPLALFVSFLVSDWLLISGVVLAVLWDIYHSSMQTFGFSRIYDAKAGNPPTQGRVLDMLLNHVIYIGPIFIGRNLAPNIAVINRYAELGWRAPSRLFNFVGTIQRELAQIVLVAGGAYIVFYVLAYTWLVRERGHRISATKVWLLLSTASVSILAWGFLPPFQAFFIANFFHALQYFAIVWATERRTLQRLVARPHTTVHPARALALFCLCVFAVGTAHTLFDVPALRLGFALFTVVSLMHFWYDGFIWSVRRAEVKVAA